MTIRTTAIIGLILLGCSSRQEKPAGILKSSEMVHMYTEMYVAEERVTRLSLPRDSAEKVFKLIEKKVFEKNNIADSVFRQSIAHYMNHPKDLELIYTAVVDSLNLREQRATAKKLKE
jgi:Domain of unknown function (DUF4296)